MNSNRNKLALRRQSIRTLTASELRIVNGGGTNGAPAPGTDRQTISGGTSVIAPSTSVIRGSNVSTVISPSTSVIRGSVSVYNPSGG
ncbi:MAG: hypothetical protein QOD90_34 [Mycobacterium sp.]|jgi:hypothetical protein|nr:hypothetical protein [Mycobacterium sp.]